MPLLFLPKKEVCQEDAGCAGEVDQEMEPADAEDDVQPEPAVPGDGDVDAAASEEPLPVAEEQQSVPAPVIEPVPSGPAVSSEEGARGPPPERHQSRDLGSVKGGKEPAPREEHPPPVHSTPATERGRGSAEQLAVPEPVMPAPVPEPVVVDNRPAWKKTKYAHLFE